MTSLFTLLRLPFVRLLRTRYGNVALMWAVSAPVVLALVGVSMTREIGPVLTSLVIAGRVGAAITAELATMKVTEQVEALETISLNPVRYLVAPRFLALLVMLPCLVILGNIVGMFGGYVVGVTQHGFARQDFARLL